MAAGNYDEEFLPDHEDYLEDQLFKTIEIAVMGILIAILFYLFWNWTTGAKSEAFIIKDTDSFLTAVAKFKLGIKMSKDVHSLLLAMRKRIQKNAVSPDDATACRLSETVIECIEHLKYGDKNIETGINVLNELWAQDSAKKAALKDEHLSYLHIKSLLDLFYRLRGSKEVEIPKNQGWLSESNIPYSKFEYKCVMTIGLLATDFPDMQTYLGDHLGIKFVVDTLQDHHKTDVSISKWCFWTLTQLSSDHPPNKKEVVDRGALPLVIKCLATFPQFYDMQLQGLVLVLTIISNDTKTKINLTNTRQMVLNYGIYDILMANHRINKELQIVCKSISEYLITPYS